MIRTIDDLILAAILVCVWLAAMLDGSCGDHAQAQAQSRPRESDATVLARILIAEADGHSADYAPILSVLATRADRVHSTPAAVGRRYAAVYHTRRRPSPRIVEILALPGVVLAPRRRMWARALEAAHRWLAGDHADGCAERPAHWGDRHGDRARALRMRWREVDCGANGRTINQFWRER